MYPHVHIKIWSIYILFLMGFEQKEGKPNVAAYYIYQLVYWLKIHAMWSLRINLSITTFNNSVLLTINPYFGHIKGD